MNTSYTLHSVSFDSLAIIDGIQQLTNQILYKMARKFLAEAQSSQRK